MLSLPIQRGFTLLELLVALAIVAILTLVIAPGLSTLYAQNQLQLAARSVLGALNHARTHAQISGKPVGLCNKTVWPVCQLEDAADAPPGQNWIIYQDNNGNQRFDDGDTILQSRNIDATQDAISATRRTAPIFSTLGAAGANMSIVICNPRIDEGIKLVISNSGRIRNESTQCRAHGD